MQKLYIFFFLLFVLAGCENKTVKFISGANDIAEIHLLIHPNHHFSLHFKPVDEKQAYNFKGYWGMEDENYVLTFYQDKNGIPLLEDALFNKDEKRSKVNIIDKSKVSFHKNIQTIEIYGVYCTREKN